ncbi:MAG TPA: alpha/beta hydrolase domain-containing protein [Hyphomicrobiaceae bacterium]
MPLTRFEITSRVPYAGGRRFGAAGAYEQVDGAAHFAVDPNHPANALICDLKLAPRNGAGLVEFAADFSVVLPVDARLANGRCIVELPNRGRRRVVAMMNCAPPDAPVGPQAHPGDGFLFARGYTVVSVGWQWDVYPSPELMGLVAPAAMADGKPIGGETIVEIRPNERGTTRLLADRIHRPLPAAPGEQPGARLLVRDWEDGEDTLIPRSSWRFAREMPAGAVEPSAEHVWLEGGFEPGRIYHLVYATDRAPVAGLGLLAARDVAAFLRTPSPTNPCGSGFRALILYGISQTGRMQRHFLSLGLNRCEDGSRAYDGFHVHVAGARRGAFNHRFAQPSNQTTPLWGHVFPFADVATSDPLTGSTGGLLDRQVTTGDLPKIISTDSAAEYWRGDAALAHIDTTGRRDLPEHPSTRRYLFAGVQHTPGYPGQSRTHPGTGATARYPLNVLDYLPLLRAALINLDRWITEGVEPPPSRHPRISDATAVERKEVLATFARLPDFEPPDPQRLPFVRTVDMGGDEAAGIGRYPAREGAFYPALVSAVDGDGNETGGIRLPDITVPVGTHAGWNPRDPVTGSPEQIVAMNGLTLWFAPDEATRVARGDPRRSLAERYRDEADYGAKVRAAAVRLAAERYLLEEDVDRVVEAAVVRYRAAIAQ